MAAKVEHESPVEGRTRQLPRHVVIIPDGNGRWAQKHNLPVWEGHLKGAQQMLKLANAVEELNIDVCTFWGFSTENWSRSTEEVGKIFQITHEMVRAHADEWVAKGRRFKHIGRKDRLPADLLELLTQFEQMTATNTGQTFVLALDYGGRDEIVRAVYRVGTSPVDEESFKQFLDTAGLPDPDLIVRTSDECRTSGVYPYQGVYAEFISSPVFFPDFDRKELNRCLAEFALRKRRFGARPEGQVSGPFSWLGMERVSFDSFVKTALPHVQRAGDVLLQKWRTDRFYNHPALQEDIDVYQRLLAGGKKLRAALLVLGYENFGGEPEYREGALIAAAGYEILHNAFLIHDDIEDSSPVRRGQPSVHEEYRQRHQAQGVTKLDSAQYGRAIALNTGNIGAVKMQGVLWQIQNKSSRILEAQKWIRFVVETTMLGQRRDLTEIPLGELGKKQVYEIYHQKTAVYTVVGPLALGAILAGASAQEIGHINSFGTNLGIAFQMIDDHLGLYGSEEVIGKPVGSDLAEAKKTIHFVETWRRADSAGRDLLASAWGRQDVSDAELEQVRQLVVDLGVKEYVFEIARELALKAKGVIPRIATNNTSAVLLDQLADVVVNRKF